MIQRLIRFLSELKRRRVYRVAAAYVVASFTLLEATELVLPALSAPAWIYRGLVLLVLAGCPVVVVLAWLFEITPEGVRRDRHPEETSDEEVKSSWLGRPLLLGTLVVGTVGVGAWLAGRKSVVAPSGDPSTLVVLPFVPAVHDSTLERLGRDLVVTLSSSLAATADLSTVDALSVLSNVSAGDPIPLARAGELAASMNAGHLLRGALFATGDGISVDLSLYTTDGLRRLGSRRVEAQGIEALTDSATLAVLRMMWQRAPSAPPSPGAVSTGSPEALHAYLEGEQAIVEGRWREAPEHFTRAIEADSSFWYAYWRLEYALGFHGTPVDSGIRARVRAHRDEFPEKDRLLIEAASAPAARRLEILRDVTKRFPTYWPGWWDLSEVLVHDGGYLGHTLAESRAALERTVALNPHFTSAWSHLFWVASRRRDAGTMARIVDELASSRYDEVSLQEAGINSLTYYRAQQALVQAGGSVPAEVVKTGIDELSAYRGPIEPELISSSLMQDGFVTAQVRVSRGILGRGEASPPMRRAQRFVLTHALAGLGAWDSALVAADEYGAVASRAVDRILPYRIAVVGTWAGGLDATEAEARRPRTDALSGRDPELAAEIAWLDGVLAFAENDRDALGRAREALREGDGHWREPLVRSLDGFDMALGGDWGQAGRVLAKAARESADGELQFGYGEAHPFLDGVQRLEAARLLLESGDTVSARPLLTWYEVVLPGELYRLALANQVLAAPAFALRADIARAVGLDREASRFEELRAERRP